MALLTRSEREARHIGRICRCVNTMLGELSDLCQCENPGDPDSDECRFCRAWIDMAESINEAIEQYEHRIGDSHVDA